MSNKAHDKIHKQYSKFSSVSSQKIDGKTWLESTEKTWDHTATATTGVDDSLYYYLRDFMRDLK